MDYTKLKLLIIKEFGTMTAFSIALGVSNQFVSGIISSGKNMNSETIIKWAKVLKIKKNDIGVYFFTKKVGKSQL